MPFSLKVEKVKPRSSDKLDTLLTMLKSDSDEDIEFLINFVKLWRASGKFKNIEVLPVIYVALIIH